MASEDDPALETADDWESHWQSFGGVLSGSPAKPFRYNFILESLRRAGCRNDDLLLDIGAGTGDFLCFAAEHGCTRLAAVEYARAGVEIIRNRLPEAVASQCDLAGRPDFGTWRAPPARFAVCSEVLEHVDDPVTLLKNARALLAEGALVVVTVPGGPRTEFDKHIGHRAHFDPTKIAAVAEAAGYDVVRSGRIGFPFFNLYRIIIYLMGRRVQAQARKDSRAKKIFSAVFRLLLRFDLPVNLGWQVYAVIKNR
jgi:SAM-dependent methyltransferase